MALRTIVVAVAAGLSVLPLGVCAQTRTATVYFQSATASSDGYENASIEVAYQLMPCAGDVVISVQRVRGSVKPSQRYWFEGEQVAASAQAPDRPLVRFAGTVFHGGSPIGRFSIEAGDALGFGCYTGDTQSVARIADFIGPQATDEARRAFINALSINVEHTTAPLRNGLVENEIKAERRRLAAEEARRQQEAKRAAEAEQQAARQAEAETEARANARQQNAGGGAERYADGDFWGTGTGQAGGQASTGSSGGSSGGGTGSRAAQPQQPVERDWVAETNEMLARRQREHDEARAAADAQFERQMEGFQRSWYAGQQGRQARENIAELSQVRRSYDSVEELERDFQRRQSVLQAEFRRLEESQSAVRQSEIARNFGDSEPVVGAVVGLVSGLIDRADREREARQAREELAAERRRQLEQMEARRRALEAQRLAMVRSMRADMLAQFTDGNLPLSSDDIDVPVLHFFSYTVDPTRLGQPNPPLHVTDSFEVYRNGDGTWPFKHALNADLRRAVPGEITLMGFYATRALADEARRELLGLARLGEFDITEVAYSRAPQEQGYADGIDFWSDQPAERTDGPIDFWRRSDAPPQPEGEP